MRKNIYKIITFIIILLPLYVYAADTGNISISCSPSTIKSGNETKCTIKGSSTTEITGIESTISLTDNLEIVSFVPSDNWQGNDVSDKKISVYHEGIKDDFTIGVLTLKTKSEVYGKNEKVTLTKTVFSHDKKEYNISDVNQVIRIPSNNANLSSIKINGDGKFFDKNKTSFSTEVTSETANITVTTEDSKATVTGDGSKTLKYADNKYTIVVTAEDGTKKEYVITINRPDSRSKDNYLLSFEFYNYDKLSFDKDKTSYDLTVENSVSSLCIGYRRPAKEYIPNYCLLVYDYDYNDIEDLHFLINGVDIDEEVDAYEEDYFTDYFNKTDEKCNDDETECYDYLDGEVVGHCKFGDYTECEYYYEGKIFEQFKYKKTMDDEDAFSAYLFDLKEGSNKLEVIVTAENGDERVYTFNISRKDKDGKVVEKDELPPPTGNVIYIVIGILLVVSLGTGIYFYHKKQSKK